MADEQRPPAISLTINPIGFIRTAKHVKFAAPHQPKDGAEERNLVELLPGMRYEQALQDLAGFERIWLIWWFHKNNNWRPLVLPPRGPSRRRGVFATRSPHRPNPIGMTAVRLLAVEDLRLIIGNCDLVDGTPIIDIKPYLSTVDAFPDSSLGWLAGVEQGLSIQPNFEVILTDLAQEQLSWLLINHKIDFKERALEILARDPSLHRTRRIRKFPGDKRIIGCGAWRIVFSVNDRTVLVEYVLTGYPDRLLNGEGYKSVPDREAQIEFNLRYACLSNSQPSN